MDIMIITEATPIIIPSIVKKLPPLFIFREAREVRILCLSRVNMG
jgi:hypothetical protein